MPKLLLEENAKLVFLGTRQWTTDKGKLLTFVKLGDPQKFINFEFMIDPTKITINHPLNVSVRPEFEIDIYNNRTSLNLIGLALAK